MIKSMDMEFIHILTEDHTKVNGLTVNSMEKEYLSPLKEHKEKEYGMKARESNGLMKVITIILKTKNESYIHYFKYYSM